MKLDRFLPGAAAGIVLGATLSAFAATRTYQYTGAVKDASKTRLSVDKGGEIWDFAVDEGTKGADVKVGDKVVVTYRMLATRVEKK